MGLGPDRLYGIRKIVNGTAPNPEQESDGIREDIGAEIAGTVATFADLPGSGNWPGRRRFVTALRMTFVWSGSSWLADGGNLPLVSARAGDALVISSFNQRIPYNETIRATHSAMLNSSGAHFAPVHGWYRAYATVRLNNAAGSEFVLAHQQAGQGAVDIAYDNGSSITGEAVVYLEAGDYSQWFIRRNVGASTGMYTPQTLDSLTFLSS